MVQPESTQPDKGHAGEPETGTLGQTPKSRKIIFYSIDLLLIFVPLGGLLYFMFDPPAFDAFLDWMVGLF